MWCAIASRINISTGMPFFAAAARTPSASASSISSVKPPSAMQRVSAGGADSSTIEEAPKLPAAARVLELAQGLGFDLADAFAGDAELLADFLEGVVGVHADAKAHAQHALLARRERGQHARGRLAKVALDRRVDR